MRIRKRLAGRADRRTCRIYRGIILKKKIEQLLNGTFEYSQPQLLFSKEKITVTCKAGETVRGDLHLGASDGRKIRGYVTSSSRRVVPGLTQFAGKTICLPYGVDAVGMAPGERLEGWIGFVTSIGEGRISFEIQTEKEELKTKNGPVQSLEAFYGIAKRDFREAFKIFTDKTFPLLLEGADERQRALFDGLSRQPVTYQHLEEFLIGMGVKEKVEISLQEPEAEFYQTTQTTRESLHIHRSGWGHLRLELETEGEFLEIPKKVITDEDFIGSTCEVDYLLRGETLGAGNRLGKILVKSPYQRLSYNILASKSPKVEVHVRIQEKRHRLSMLRDYLAYRCGSMDLQTWTASAHYELNQLKGSGCLYPEYQMYEAYLLHQEGDNEAAVGVLRQYEDKIFSREELEFAGIYLYLCYLTGLYRDKAEVVRKVRNFYMQKGDSFPLFWILLQIDPELLESPSGALFQMEELCERGCKSPFLYLAAWELVRGDISLLHRLNSFWAQVFLFAARRGLLTKELTMRLAYLSGYEKQYSESLYRALAKGYESFPEEDVLEAICKYVMKGNPRRPEYFRWYSAAVEAGLRLTRLYEYYVETMDTTGTEELPKMLLLYFSYNNDFLSDEKKAFIYSRVIANRQSAPVDYETYQKSMEAFARRKLADGSMNEHYAAIYQEFLTNPKTRREGEALAQKLHIHRIYCDDSRIRSVVVRHSQLAKEEIYPCIQGVAYPRIYTEDAAILFQDEKQRRYAATVQYSRTKLLGDRELTEKVLRLGVEEPGTLLSYCSREPVSRENLDIFHRLERSPALDETFCRQLRRRILSFYAENSGDESLDESLREMDFRAYAQVDRVMLLSVLVARGMFKQAAGVVEEFGFEGMEKTDLLKLTSRMILRGDLAMDEELLALASEIYRGGLYDEVILQYLMKYRVGPLDELISIWKSARGFEMDTYAAEERLLGLLMLASDYREDGEDVLESYVKHRGRERLIGAYLTQVSYGTFVKGFPMRPFVKECLKRAYLAQWNVDFICHLALLQELAQEETKDEETLSLVKHLLKECMQQNLQFAFFEKLPEELLSRYQLDDKTYVEYHADPRANVTLFYALDTGLGLQPEYKNEPLHDLYEGIRTRAFTLFYGETLHYYFQIEMDGKVEKTGECTLSMNQAKGEPASRYQQINRILAARHLKKEEEVTARMEQYLRQDQYVREMFVLRKGE